MATYTENYNLTLAAEEDYYDIGDANGNWETLDAALAQTEERLDAQEAGSTEISQKLGDADDENSDTIFGKLNQIATGAENRGLTAIKSIQRVVYEKTSSTSGSVEINEVVPENCIVIFERLLDSYSGGCGSMDYELAATTVTFSHAANSTQNITIGLWIVEFC